MRTTRSRAALAAAGILTLTLTSCAAGGDGADLEQVETEASAPAAADGGPDGNAGGGSDLPGTPVSEAAPHLPVDGTRQWNDTQDTAVNWVLPEAYASVQFQTPDGGDQPLSITTDDGVVFADQSGVYLLPWDGSETRLLTSEIPGEGEEVSTGLAGTEVEVDGQRGIVSLLIPEEDSTWPTEPHAVLVMADGTETLLDVSPELAATEPNAVTTVDASDSTFEGGSVPLFTTHGAENRLFHLDVEAGAISPSPIEAEEVTETDDTWHWAGGQTAHLTYPEDRTSATVTFYGGELYPWEVEGEDPVAEQTCTLDPGFDDFLLNRILQGSTGTDPAGAWLQAGPALLETATGDITCLDGIPESSPDADGTLWLSNPEKEVRLVPAGESFADGTEAMAPEPGDVVVVPGMTSPDGAWTRMHRTDVHGYTADWTPTAAG